MARVRAIRNAPEEHDLQRDLAPFLHHKSNHVIAAAADVVKRLELSSLTPGLIAAFTDLFPKAPERDQGCKALIAIAGALVSMGEDAAEVYLKGTRHIQMEGSFGPPEDVAAPLRGVCARGLVRMRHPEALYETVALLVDRRIMARVGAVQALGDSGSREAELLLRLKVLQGDEEDVIANCFVSLLANSSERSIAFVAGYLQASSDERIESAALALGESRLTSALPYLVAAWESNCRRTVRRSLLLSIAMSRREEGVNFLLSRLREDSEQAAADALEALALYQSDENVRSQVQAVASTRKLRVDWAR